jgi:hypothetical protein
MHQNKDKAKLNSRNELGSQLSEFPVAVAFLVLFVMFGLVDLSTLLIGVNNIHNAARNAALNAAKARNFADAQTKAQDTVNKVAGGVQIQSVTVSAYEVPISANHTDSSGNALQTTQILPAGTPPIIDTSNFQYQIQVIVKGSVSPLAQLSFLSGLANVPGLTGPVEVTAKYSSLCEDPAGLGN